MLNGYDLTIWADGFRHWHGKITFDAPGLGNTPEAARVFARAERYAKRNLRRIVARNDGIEPGYRLRYRVKANQVQPGSGRLVSLTYEVMR